MNTKIKIICCHTKSIPSHSRHLPFPFSCCQILHFFPLACGKNSGSNWVQHLLSFSSETSSWAAKRSNSISFVLRHSLYVCLIIWKSPYSQGHPPSTATQQLAKISQLPTTNGQDCHSNFSPYRITVTSCLVMVAFHLILTTQIKINSTKTESGTHNRHWYRVK